MADPDYGELVKRLRVWPYGIRLEAADAIEHLSRDLAAARREIAELRERLRALAEAGQQ